MITKQFILLMLVAGVFGEYEDEVIYGGKPKEIYIGKIGNCSYAKNIIKEYLKKNPKYKKNYIGSMCMEQDLFLKTIRSGKTPPIGMIPFPMPKPKIPNPQKKKYKELKAK